MASQKFSYEDYLNEYDAIMRNQKVVNKLLKAPVISKKKKTLIIRSEVDAAQPRVAQTYCKSFRKYNSRSLEKRRIATCSDPMFNPNITSLFQVSDELCISITRRMLIKKFVNLLQREENEQ